MALYGDEKHNEVNLEQVGGTTVHAGTVEEISLDKVKVKLRVGKTSKGLPAGELIQGFERDDTEGCAEYNAALDALESLILAHACEGIDVASEAYQNSILTTLEQQPMRYSCPLLDRSNPRWQENRQELYDSLFPINKGLAHEIWWWVDGVLLRHRVLLRHNAEYLHILTMPIEDIPKLLNSKDETVQVLVEWRLKHGQDLQMHGGGNLPS